MNPVSSKGEVNAFISTLATTSPTSSLVKQGRLLFAMDATASREPSWDQACSIQAQMFLSAGQVGGLQVQLCYFRGFHEFHATQWLSDTHALARHMTQVRCAGGNTQIGKTLDHALKEARQTHLNAVVFIGDCMEENIDQLCSKAGALGLLGVRIFIFQEGYDTVAEKAFREITRLSSGAYCRFDSASADQLRQLLSAVAVYAAGGQQAFDNFIGTDNPVLKRLSKQLHHC